MTSKYEVTKGMTFAVSDAPVTAEDFNASGFRGLVLLAGSSLCNKGDHLHRRAERGYRRNHAVLN